MFELKRKIDGLIWKITPPRKKLDVVDAKKGIETEFATTPFDLVCPYVDGDKVYTSYCRSTGSDISFWDFALKFQIEHGLNDSIIYIESQGFRDEFGDQFLLVALERGEVVVDTICGIDDIFSEIVSFIPNVDDFTFKLSGVDISFPEQIGFELADNKVIEVNKPLTEVYLPKDDCLFVSRENFDDRLKPKGIYLRWVLPIVAISVAVFLIFSEGETDVSQDVVYVTVDKEEDYKKHMLGLLPQASNRFAQDYNNHTILEKVARGWEVSRVVHSNESNVIYQVRNDSGSLRELRAIVETVSKNTQVPAILDISETGNIITFQGLNVPIYTENSVVVWNVREAYEFFSDSVTFLVPNMDINFTGFQARSAESGWKSMNISLDFQLLPVSQLMVLSKITKNMPISLVNANYVNKNGLLTGNFQIQIHGED